MNAFIRIGKAFAMKKGIMLSHRECSEIVRNCELINTIGMIAGLGPVPANEKTPAIRIYEAADNGKGVRLSRDECRRVVRYFEESTRLDDSEKKS